MQPIRKADCPNCGGPIEFRLGSSAAAICSYCRFSVVRTDRALEAIGKIADLVPTAPVMSVGDRGTIQGQTFEVGGRLQLDHGQGPWDEWYVELENGRWGWLAKAQGNWYLTHPMEGARVPAWDAVAPGAQILIPDAGNLPLTVEERGGSALLSAEGELPFPAVPQQSGRHADLSGPGGVFVTIDYGDGSEPPQLFLGRQVPADQVSIRGTALGPGPEQKVDAERLRCPTCGAPVPIFTPETTERAACGSCHSLLDYSQGNLAFIERLEQRERTPLIPLGSEGVLKGEEAIVIGFMERFTISDGMTFAWAEYLLHTRNGYRWLQEDHGHWTYLRPINAGDVQHGIGTSRFRGRRYKSFSSSQVKVRLVLGEFYWKVRVGEETYAQDYVAPPRLLSVERSETEVNWTAGEYVPPQEVWKSFSLGGRPPHPSGVAPAQPNPVQLGWSLGVCGALLLALTLMAMFIGSSEGGEVTNVNLKPVPHGTTTPEDAIVYSRPFDIADGPTTLRMDLETNVSNAWLGVAAALINENTNQVREFYIQAEEWHGVTGGESWQEGDPSPTEYLGEVPAGRYSMRFESQWGTEANIARGVSPQATLHVTAGKRSAFCCLGAGLLIMLPLLLGAFRKTAFEGRRWSNSDTFAEMMDS